MLGDDTRTGTEPASCAESLSGGADDDINGRGRDVIELGKASASTADGSNGE